MTALLLGIAGGFAPGPLNSLILNAALKRGVRAALRYAVAPLLSDALPVVLSLLVARAAPDWAARGLAVAGGAFVVHLGVAAFRDREPRLDEKGEDAASRDYLKGVLTNALNPHPWIFWLGVGAPMLRAAWSRGGGYAAAWVVLFYVGLVGSKAGLAVAIGRGRRVVTTRWLGRLIVASAAVMVAIGGWLMWQGITGRL
jgi:threonine/homoserine/homoserine lactone efflux protein